jgi:SAM-dependent methyltransferase
MSKIKQITIKEFEKIFNEKLDDFVRQKILEYDFSYKEIPAKKRDEIIMQIIDMLLDNDVNKAGKHRQKQWEKGWKENLTEISNSNKKGDIPKYFGKYEILRWKQKFIEPLNENFELNSLAIIQNWIFNKYLKNAENIYEFGCGTGHNLSRVREINQNAKIFGLDWTESSQKIIKKVAKEKNDKKLFAKKFDFFKPDYKFKLGKNSIIFTVAALEQTGSNFDKFLKYLLKNQPSACIHIEPISEVLDNSNLLDYLSISYFKKRNYLIGFLDYLKKLEQEKKIIIHKIQRTFIGSIFIEGYSVIVWSPINN